MLMSQSGSSGDGQERPSTESSTQDGATPAEPTLGKRISEGHAFEKHVVRKGEYNGLGVHTPAALMDEAVPRATDQNVRPLSGGRTASGDDATGTVVIHTEGS